MLSFINMGGSRKKRRRSKKGSSPPSRDKPLAAAKRASLRASASFISPGDLGDAPNANSSRATTVLGSRNKVAGPSSRANLDKDLPIPVSYGGQRSPEIQLEFKHDSLLKTVPGEFLRNRKGSLASSADENTSVRPFIKHNPSGSTSTLEASPLRKNGDKSRRSARPSVTPIQIPLASVQTIPLQLKKRASRSSRKSRSKRISVNAPPSPAWASDSELDPVSAVSGVSAARDILSKSFSFSARTPATGMGFGDAASQGKRDSDSLFAKELSQRIARQDSATLPRDLVWETMQETKSISHKSSSQSLKKRKRDAVISIDPIPSLEAFVASGSQSIVKLSLAKIPDDDERNDSAVPTRKDSLFRPRARPPRVNPPPQSTTPSTQKLDTADQAALHRVSRIVERDTDASSIGTSPAFSPLNKGFRSPKSVASSSKITPTTDPTSPSLYSSYESPHQSPRKPSGPSSYKSDSDLDSFLEGFKGSQALISPYFGKGKSNTKVKSPKTPLSVKGSVPPSASTVSSSPGPSSGSLSGAFRIITQRQIANRTGVNQSSSGSSTPSKVVSQSTYAADQNKYARATPTSSAPQGDKSSSRFNECCTSSITSISVKSPVTQIHSQVLPKVVEHIAPAENSPSIYSTLSNIEIISPDTGTPEGDKRRPSLPQLRVNSIMLSPSSGAFAASPGQSSCQSPGQSPDLLDMLIPNGHIVTPISRHKRSGSTPSPIRIINTPQRYSPVNGDSYEEVPENTERNLCNDSTPSSGDYAQSAQTFPETPVLFSPDFPQELPTPSSGRPRLSRSISASSIRKFAHTRNTSVLRSAASVHPIAIPSTPRIPITLEEKSAEAHKENGYYNESPPISPLPPPPTSLLNSELLKPIPIVQVASERKPTSPPLLAPAPKKKATRPRPPLPFGPRKQSNSFINKVTPLAFSQKRKAASESTLGISQLLSSEGNRSPKKVIDNSLASPTLETPTFKTTPIPWRGLTLEAAKWTFTSSQFQDIVRQAIVQSGEGSAIRILPQEVVDRELPGALHTLQKRKADVESDYKVKVRRRRALLQELATLRPDPTHIKKIAEELTIVTANCDQLVEELHSVCDQITQINQLKDSHLSSALATALRKLNASLTRRTEQSRKLELDLGNAYSEFEELWRQAEEKDQTILVLQSQLDAISPQSGTNSQRSSRASLGLSRRGSRRASLARLQLSGSNLNFGSSNRRQSQRSSRSSLHVNVPTSQRATFTFIPGEGVPPVPPLPTTQTTASQYSEIATAQSLGSSVPSAGLPSTDRLYHAVYDMLGVCGKDRAVSPARPVSATIEMGSSGSQPEAGNKLGAAKRDVFLAAASQHTHMARSDEHLPLPSRRGSLPLNASTYHDYEFLDPELIVAMIDF